MKPFNNVIYYHRYKYYIYQCDLAQIKYSSKKYIFSFFCNAILSISFQPTHGLKMYVQQLIKYLNSYYKALKLVYFR